MVARVSLHLSSRPTTIVAWSGCALFIVLIWLITFESLHFDRQDALDAATRENENRAIAFQQYVARTLETANVAGAHLAARFADKLDDRWGDRPPLRLVDAVADNPLFAAVIVTDASGDVRYTTLPNAPPLNVAARQVFEAARDSKSDSAVLSSPGMSPILGRAIFSVTRAIRNADGRFAGTVIVQTPIERLTAFNEGARTRPLDLISVIRSDGITLARRTGTQISYGENLRGRSAMVELASQPNGSNLSASALDGQRRLFSHRRLDEFPVFVVVGVGERDVLAPVAEQSLWYGGAAAALSAAFLALAWLIVANARRRDRAALELEEANRRYEQAQRIGRIGDWTYDPASRTMTWSRPLLEMYGRDPEQTRLTLDEALSAYDPPGRDRLMRAIDAALATGEPQLIECIAHVRRAKPSVRRLVFSPIAGEDGQPVGLSGTDQDVSQEKLHERLRDEVAHRGRVESMNLMAVTLAHELAQPLTAASNYLMVARAFADDHAPAEDGVTGALDQVNQQIGLMREIMYRAREMLSRKRATDDKAVVRSVIDDAVSLVKVANRSDIEVEVRSFDEECAFAANKVQVQQVLMNLLRNAGEALKDTPDPRIAITVSEEPEQYIRLCVEDNGPGFPTGYDKAFSAFAETGSGGLGLGLSISRAIIESYGGSIWLEPRRGGGSVVCFRLPACGRAKLRAPAPAKLAPPAGRGGRRLGMKWRSSLG